MREEIVYDEIRPTIHELSIIKQVIQSRSHSLEVLREALSNMCTPEIGAQQVHIQFFLHPDYGSTFIFRDDGCGMDYTGDINNPGRLDKFINLGFSGVAGLKADKYSWKGLGSKLMLNCRKNEITTWSGDIQKPLYKVEVSDPRSKILQDIPEWPKYYISRRSAEQSDRKGTTIIVYGYEGGNITYSFDDLSHYLYWNTIVGITKHEEGVPHVFLKVGIQEKEMELGYRWILSPDQNFAEGWKTVIINPPIIVNEQATTGENVQIILKGGFTENTANACGPGISLSKFRHNTGLRLSVLGIPYFRLDFPRLKGDKFQQYQELCSFVVECDALSTKLNIDRSGYNIDDPIVQAFERATRKAFDQFTLTDGYKEFKDRKRKEDERTKSKFLNERKMALGSGEQQYVCVRDENEGLKVIHRAPKNEPDTLALFWKLEGLGLLPFAQFTSLEYTGKGGIDVIATFQEKEDSQLRIMEAVEFEHAYENFIVHGHNPKQTSLIICWEIRDPRKLQQVNDWTFRAVLGAEVLTVLELQKIPRIEVHLRRDCPL